MDLKIPKVSVVIPVYNGEKFLSEAIESVINQTYSNWEIIVVNDGSTDGSIDILSNYNRKLSWKFYVINQKNYGPSIARNRAITKAKGEYIAFLDSDDTWLPEKLKKQVEFLELNRNIVLVYSDCYIIDSNGSMEENNYFYRTKPFKGKTLHNLLNNNFIPTSTVILRRRILNDIGLFNIKFRISQDYDLWLRIAEKYTIDFLDEPLAKYRFHTEGISRNVELMVNEDFQILKYWLNKNPDLKRELKKQIKFKRAHLHYQKVLYYYHNYKIRKAIIEFIKWGLCICNLLKN